MTTPAATSESRRGLAFGLTTYALWGILPLFFLSLSPSSPWEILAHRVLWSLLLCAILLGVTRGGAGLVATTRSPRRLAALATAGSLIAVNWTTYLVATTSGHITDAALGYFLNPLVSVALGLVVLRETLRTGQKIAVGIGAVGALYLAVASGSMPWIALGLAFSFGFYALAKKQMGVSLSAVESLTGETVVLAPVAACLLWWCVQTGRSTFTDHGAGHALLLVATGVVTAVPLLLFAATARRVTLVTIGLMQFIAPVLQLIVGLATGEVMSPARWVGFVIVWCALFVLVSDTLRQAHRSRRARRRRADETDAFPR